MATETESAFFKGRLLRPAAPVCMACLATAAALYGLQRQAAPAGPPAAADHMEDHAQALPGRFPEREDNPAPDPTAETAGTGRPVRLSLMVHQPLALSRFIDDVTGTPHPLPLSPSYEELIQELGAEDLSHTLVIGGIDYSDPAGDAAVPLVRVAHRRNERLSPSFRVRDFASRDGAPYARISDRLVKGLEGLRARAGSLVITSGYRHRAHNAKPEVGGAAGSQHIAGRAADVWSSRKAPLELAELALQTFGCNVGLGLGANILHIDVRGHLASWAYPDAPMSEPAFDAWVLEQCGYRVPQHLKAAAEAAAPAAQEQALTQADSTAAAPPPTAADLLQQHASVLSAYARTAFREHGPGAVVLDLRTPDGDAAQPRYALATSREARRLKLAALLKGCTWNTHFVYVIITPAGEHLMGQAPYAPRIRQS